MVEGQRNPGNEVCVSEGEMLPVRAHENGTPFRNPLELLMQPIGRQSEGSLEVCQERRDPLGKSVKFWCYRAKVLKSIILVLNDSLPNVWSLSDPVSISL